MLLTVSAVTPDSKTARMALTRPIPVTDARMQFSSLVFVSNLSHTPPVVAVNPNLPAPSSFHQQQVQDQYWITPMQETNNNVLSRLCC